MNTWRTDTLPKRGVVVLVQEGDEQRLATWDGHDWRCIGSDRVLDTVQGWREVPAAKVLA